MKGYDFEERREFRQAVGIFVGGCLFLCVVGAGVVWGMVVALRYLFTGHA